VIQSVFEWVGKCALTMSRGKLFICLSGKI